MELAKEFFDNLDKLKKYKTDPDLNFFFDTIDKLEKLNNKSHDTILDKSKHGKQAHDLTVKLGIKKEEIAMSTKTQKEYDAVYACIGYLENHFN